VTALNTSDFYMNQQKGIWVAVVTIIVIAALGLWWMAASRPLNMPMFGLGNSDSATTTDDVASSTLGTSKTGSKTGTVKNTVKKNQDVATIVRNLSTGSTFAGYFRSTGVAATINPKSTSKYTIFVPTNGAFAQLAPGTISAMSGEEKKRLVQYHVVSGRAIDPDALSAGQIEALSRDMLNFSYGTNKIPMVNSAIVITQYQGTNGVVIVIDNVLLPPKR
jgi:uncharacterized surface protein with fasciclin (FAS1) repeats